MPLGNTFRWIRGALINTGSHNIVYSRCNFNILLALTEHLPACFVVLVQYPLEEPIQIFTYKSGYMFLKHVVEIHLGVINGCQ